jgi:TonB family protein
VRGESRADFHLEPNWWEPACGKHPVAQVGGADVAPRVIHRVDPAWPEYLRTMRLRGIIIIAAVVTETGDVCDARVVRGFPGKIGIDIGDAAVRAVKQWRFAPATKQGKPVAAVYHLTINLNTNADVTMRPQ